MTLKSTDKPSIVKPKEWSVGEPLTARRLNEPVKVIRQLIRGVEPARQLKSSSRSTSVDVRQFRIKSIDLDFMICREWNGTAEGDADFIIAKPPLLRASVTERTFGVLTATYSAVNSTGTQRTATVGGDSETQVVIPSYEVDDVVYAIRNVKGGTGATREELGNDIAVDWLELNQGRAWATKAS